MANGHYLKRLDDRNDTIFLTAMEPPNDNNKDTDDDQKDNLTHCDVCEDDKIESIKPFKKYLGKLSNTWRIINIGRGTIYRVVGDEA